MSEAPLTIRAVGDLWGRAVRDSQAVPFWLLGDFMDDFRLRSTTDLQRQSLVRDEPEWIVNGGEFNAYLAALVESLCREARIEPPAWTESPCRFLTHPWFAGGFENLKAIATSTFRVLRKGASECVSLFTHTTLQALFVLVKLFLDDAQGTDH